MAKCGAHVDANTKHRPGVVTARKVLAQELLDRTLVQTLDRQVLSCHLACEWAIPVMKPLAVPV